MNLLNKDPFQIIPLTFHINCKKELNEDLQFQEFESKFKEFQ